MKDCLKAFKKNNNKNKSTLQNKITPLCKQPSESLMKFEPYMKMKWNGIEL